MRVPKELAEKREEARVLATFGRMHKKSKSVGQIIMIRATLSAARRGYKGDASNIADIEPDYKKALDDWEAFVAENPSKDEETLARGVLKRWAKGPLLGLFLPQGGIQ